MQYLVMGFKRLPFLVLHPSSRVMPYLDCTKLVGRKGGKCVLWTSKDCEMGNNPIFSKKTNENVPVGRYAQFFTRHAKKWEEGHACPSHDKIQVCFVSSTAVLGRDP